MCGCEKHHNRKADCTCICEEHRNFEKARDLALARYDQIVELQAALTKSEGRTSAAWDAGYTAGSDYIADVIVAQDLDRSAPAEPANPYRAGGR